MAEDALTGVAIAAAKVLVQMVAARALEEVTLDWDFKEQLGKLKEKFEYIQAFLDDAGTSKHTQKSQLVKLWVQKVKDVAYLADDVIDEYAIEIFSMKMESKNSVEELGSFFTPSNPALFHIAMAHKVKEIFSLFDEIDKEAKNIGLNTLNRVDIPPTTAIPAHNNDDHLSQTRQVNSSLEEVGKSIVTKCQGVPLAVKVIGGLLQSKQNLHEWKAIEKSELWDLPHGRNQILPSLLLSFNHLPSPSVKQCFAYCAIIPKGHHVYKSELIGLWLSQGYLCNNNRKNLTMEEIGEENLRILLSNSLLECVSTELGIVGYKMHDLVYDLAVYVCGSDLIKEADSLRESGGCRHLLMDSGGNETLSQFPPEKTLTKLRTLGLSGTSIQWNFFIHTRYLRTLLLGRTGITEVPPAIELLQHLRFLDVSYNPISTLPESISKLYQLQTLILQGCRNMKKLPKVVNKLVNLRHVSTTAPMSAWKGLQQLTNLQSLPCLSLDNNGDGWTIDELGELHQLRDEIHIQGLEFAKDKEQARKAGLVGKAKLTKLILSWEEGREETDGGIFDEDVLGGLEPHSNITSLEVKNFIGEKFPSWITRMDVLAEGQNRTRLNNLTTIKLENCSRCQTLPTLGQLPLLKCLILSGLSVEHIGIEFYGGNDLYMPTVVSFECLNELDISGFPRLVTWMEPPIQAFPHLKTLRLRDCHLLKSVPALEIKSLVSLELESLHSVESLDIIKYSSGLTSLIMNILPKIESLPQELANCVKLKILHISNCGKLKYLPRGLESLVNLQSVSVIHCTALDFVMDLLHVRSSLREFEIVGCPRLWKIPSSLTECTSLEVVKIISQPPIKGSVTDISKLKRLWELRISCSSVHHLRLLMKSAKDLPLLMSLEIEGFRDEEEMRDYFSDITPFLRLPSLIELMLYGRPNIKTLPQQLGLLTRITTLRIWCFMDLEEIPPWICRLSSLDSLVLEDCKNLIGLPSKEDLQRLICLRITNCPLLAERYSKDGGSKWHNISHIRQICIDGKTI